MVIQVVPFVVESFEHLKTLYSVTVVTWVVFVCFQEKPFLVRTPQPDDKGMKRKLLSPPSPTHDDDGKYTILLSKSQHLH